MEEHQQEKSIRAQQEIIWHLTCGSCFYYWTYPTMDINEKLEKKALHCPLCGVKSSITTKSSS